jgi:UDP-perosamine 4-acetyltransferase
MKPKVIVLGAGGHAKVCIETLEEVGFFDIIGCTSEAESLQEVLGYPVLGRDSLLPQLYLSGVEYAMVAIGDNARRRQAGMLAKDCGYRLASAISPRAIISPRARVSCGVLIVRGAIVNSVASIGEGAIINTGATVDHDCEIGPWVHIAPGAHLAGGVRVAEGALVGIGSCVLPGVCIGAWACVGAGAVVIHDVPERAIVVGVPARKM